MSIIMGALAGAGEQMAKIGSDNMASMRKMDEETHSSGLAMERAKALEVFKNNLTVSTNNQLRTEQVGRIDAAAGKLADRAVADKSSIIQGAIADQGSWTSEQQAAVDQSLALDREQIVKDPKTRTQAAINTGDIDPKSAAMFTQKDDALLYKTLYEQAKEDGRTSRSEAANESREKVAQARIESQNRNSDARLEVMLARVEKSGSGNPTKEALNFVDGARKEVASEAANLKALYAAELKDASSTKRAKLEADYAPKFAEVEKRRAQIQEDFDNLRERVGLPKAVRAPAPAPAPAAVPPGAPPKSRPPLSQFLKK